VATPANELSDPNLIAELYGRYADALLATAYRLLMSTADAEDVVHDLFVGLPEALRHYEERGSMESWLKRIVVRLALSRIRARRYHRPSTVVEPAVAPGDAVSRITIARALAELSPSLRAVLVLKEIEGFSHREIAAMLDISTAASEVRLHRALRQMRDALAEDEER
jgi:RNA polymerase sigma factor (sigma-70 family)